MQTTVFAQDRTINGTVKDEAGKPIPKATVTARGATKGVTTNDNGSFSITVPDSINFLTVTSAEFDPKDVSIKGTTSVNVQLSAVSKKLEEVVVNVGYQTQKLKDVTGSVSQVKGEAVKNLATQDAATLLQGRVAGVDVVTPSGQPGATSQITIRGVSSLNNPAPLYVIDGVQQANGNNINPQDIESMSVLKDASAMAIYGASAAGGVIIITTKKGKGATPSINLGVRYGVSTPNLIQMLDKDDFIQYKKDIKDGNYTNPNNAADIAAFLPIDWNKELYRNGSEANYTLSISGASPSNNVNYFLSGVYNDQKGVFLDNESHMAGARINTEIKLTNAIKIGEQMNVWTRQTIPVKTPIVSTPFNSQPVFQGGPLYSADPGTAWGIYPFGYPGFNAVAQVKTATFEFPSNNFQGQAYLEAKLPIKYVTFRATFGYTSSGYQNNLFQNKFDNTGNPLTNDNGNVQNHLYRNIGNYSQTLNAYILAWDHDWGKHTTNLLAGYEQYNNQTENLLADMQNVIGNTFAYIPTSSSIDRGGQRIEGAYDNQDLQRSVFGRLNYDYNKRYYLTLTVRRDSKYATFGNLNRTGVFPALATGWNIDREVFFKKFKPTISQLKLRASYGEVGNSNIGNYKYIVAYNNGLIQNFQPNGTGQVSYTQESPANEGIKWETTKETNIGLDAQFFNGKLSLTLDWYNKKTVDLLFNTPIALSSGSPAGGTGFSGGAVTPATYTQNIGTVQNSGFDIALGYNGKKRDLSYSITLTSSFNTNKVLTDVYGGLPDGNTNYPYGTSMWNGLALTRTFINQPFGQFWGLQSLGVIKNADDLTKAQVAQPGAKIGDLMYADRNGDHIIDHKDDTTIGNPYPKVTFGLNFTATWKKFDIALLFNGALGVSLYNGVTPYEFESLNGSNVTSKVFQASGFTHNGVTNGVTEYPSVGYVDGFGRFNFDPNGNYTTPSSFFVENGSYVKLKNIQIGYTITNNTLTKAKIKSIRVYVMATNVFCITGYTGVDPELGSQYQILGLDVNGNVVGNADGSAYQKGVGAATTSRGIDGPSKYPSVRLYTAGVDFNF
ncbi:SusC/RagA family TonB-linked outer membrane protein [Ferruginibacter albus]|uniref:SusC/RagA family TonB-linked outer membrane protein n=1 Tax=Ferruginibacter albus TaxID=2875540 RepID=UPI001CC7BFFD|nr:SusC/RagA family TonB-linked outer membrane protein [Ferruginibacter albus]UAY51216.1 SusC/RagA family TonB-linked outer membrane protein [Ferruginibacter albus]